MKIKKRTKQSRMYGKNMGSHGRGARKKGKGSGHRGGKGMSGSGKRADQKKTLVTKLYGHGYFGKQGITSKGTKRDIRQRINIQQIDSQLEKYGKKVSPDKWEITLKNYKILGKGEVKNKLIITALEASKSAVEKVKKAGGEIILPKKGKKTVVKKDKESQISSASVSTEPTERKKQKKKMSKNGF